MKRLVVAVLSVALLAYAGGAVADQASDQAMANRYLQSAQSGSDDAQFYLGALYSAGVGVPRSDEEAVRWFTRAAEQGHSHAMLILGGLYAIGRGVPKDNIKAYKWAYIVGAGSRVEEFRNGARQLTSLLETRMTPDDVNLAKSDAGRWRATAGNTPAQTAAPAAVQPAPAAPAPPPAPAAAPQAAAPSSQPAKKDDVDDLMNQIPALRKKLGL
jgi:TPR repeat protein